MRAALICPVLRINVRLAFHQTATRSVRQNAASPLFTPRLDLAVKRTNDIVQTNEVLEQVNNQLQNDTAGRFFALVVAEGQQYRVTVNDLLVLKTTQPYDVGDTIIIEKVLMVGSRDFTLVGRPILPPEVVRVHATVVEKSYEFTRVHYDYIAKKNIRQLHFSRCPESMLRINKIVVNVLEILTSS